MVINHVVAGNEIFISIKQATLMNKKSANNSDHDHAAWLLHRGGGNQATKQEATNCGQEELH